MLSEDVAKKVAELLNDEAEKTRLKNEALIKERYERQVLSEAYEVIRCADIDDALDKKDIEKAFSLIYTPGKYYYLRCKDSELNEKLWKHYGYEIISEQVMTKRKHLPGYITETVNKEIPEPPKFAKFIYDKNYNNFNDLYINEKLKDKIDKLIELIKIKIDMQEKEKRIEALKAELAGLETQS